MALLVRQRATAALIVLILLAIAPPFLSSFLLTLLTQALIYAILAMSLDIILGYAGLASLGHAAYFGLGAYSVGILATRYGAAFGITLPLGAAPPRGVFGLDRATGPASRGRNAPPRAPVSGPAPESVIPNAAPYLV